MRHTEGTPEYRVGAAQAAVAILPCSRGARLTPGHMVVHSAIGQGKRQIPWADIARIDVRRVLGVRQVSISLVTGKRLTLAAPLSFLDRRFDTRVEELTGWWQTYRR